MSDKFYDLVPDDEPHDVSDPLYNTAPLGAGASVGDSASAPIWGFTPRMVAIGAAVLALVIAAIAVTGAIISSRSTDAGIAFCEAARDADDNPVGEGAGDSEPWVFGDYQDARKALADSRYEEIRDPALDLVDVAWQIDQLGEDPGLEVLPLAGEFTSAYSRFSGGCAQHGIEIPPMTG